MSELAVVALEAETLGAPISALAMSPDGRRCYLGAGSSGHLREQLGVLDLGEDGTPVGGWTRWILGAWRNHGRCMRTAGPT